MKKSYLLLPTAVTVILLHGLSYWGYANAPYDDKLMAFLWPLPFIVTSGFWVIVFIFWVGFCWVALNEFFNQN